MLSIDEMVCRLMGDHLQVETAVAVGERVKQAIRERAGESMRCSVGIGPNRLLAKVAADMQQAGRADRPAPRGPAGEAVTT